MLFWDPKIQPPNTGWPMGKQVRRQEADDRTYLFPNKSKETLAIPIESIEISRTRR